MQQPKLIQLTSPSRPPILSPAARPAAVFSRPPRTRRTGYIPATAAVARAAGRRSPSPPHLCPRAVVTISFLVRAAPTMAVRLPAILLSSICLLVLLNGMVMHGYRVFHLRYSIYSSFIVSCVPNAICVQQPRTWSLLGPRAASTGTMGCSCLEIPSPTPATSPRQI